MEGRRDQHRGLLGKREVGKKHKKMREETKNEFTVAVLFSVRNVSEAAHYGRDIQHGEMQQQGLEK